MSDASMGLRVTPWPASKGLEPTTAFPSTIMLAATWNPEKAANYATAVAEEFRARNMHVLLGPGINIYRHHSCGRNYEYMGEDPFLVSKMVVSYINGVKDVGVLPVVKHFAANNSETRRKNSNSIVSERALREIYFPGFKAAVVEADVPGVMHAYNLLNGEYCGENSWLLKKVLREEWDFNGMVVSDWTSVWNSDRAASSGLDIEMPGAEETDILIPEKMQQLLKEGVITEDDVNEKVSNLLRACISMDFYDEIFQKPELHKRDEHAQVALETAREGIVLLKNEDHILPCKPSSDKKIVVIGPTAKKTPTTGGGSGHVRPEHPVSIYDGIKQIHSSAVLLDEYNESTVRDADLVVVCVGLNTEFVPTDYSQSQSDSPSSIGTEQAAFNAKIRERIEGEGRDRKTFSLPEMHNELIIKCSKVNPNTITMINAGSGVEMATWIDHVKAVIWLFYPGQNGCQAAAEIMSGLINPSGKLPMSIEKSAEDSPAHQNPSASNNAEETKQAGVRTYQDVHYEEDIFVGYRHYDTNNIQPLFCFGHGLSYTDFTYDNLNTEVLEENTVKISFTVKNTGNINGAETAQVYVRDAECSVKRPVKELKGFKKVFLQSGETETIEIILDSTSFTFWHPDTKKWTIEPGDFNILIGSSSRDIRLENTFTLS
jgi:beta-glucosidase